MKIKFCLNGHSISESAKGKYCNKCGAEIISKCLKCEAPIQKELTYEEGMLLDSGILPPDFCENCGKPFPWQEEFLRLKEEEKKRRKPGFES